VGKQEQESGKQSEGIREQAIFRGEQLTNFSTTAELEIVAWFYYVT
jgi:hypothetical protein